MIYLRFKAPFTIATEREVRRVFGVDGPRLEEGASARFDGEVTLSRGVEFRGRCHFGQGVSVDSGSVLTDAIIDRGCRIRPYSILHNCRIGSEGIIGPFCFVRDNTVVGDRCIVGAHVEVTRSVLGHDVKVSHQAFIGDAQLGDGVIVGAGVVFCNYADGKRHSAVVGCGTVIGSGTMLVAPVSIGRDSVIGAGSVITRSIPDGHRVIQRRSSI